MFFCVGVVVLDVKFCRISVLREVTENDSNERKMVSSSGEKFDDFACLECFQRSEAAYNDLTNNTHFPVSPSKTSLVPFQQIYFVIYALCHHDESFILLSIVGLFSDLIVFHSQQHMYSF